MLKTSILAFVFILGCKASLPTGEKYDRGVIGGGSMNREKRSVDLNDGIAQQATQDKTGSPFLMSPNLQSSYFLGQCVMCPPGNPGPRGAPGPQGMPGRDGRDQIIVGPIGEQVIQSINTPSRDNESNPSSAGVTYTRWGKTSCPSTSQLVYQGVMGSGNNYNQKGSGVNFLCLPLEPTFANPPNNGGGANIFGAEYENTFSSSPGIAQSEAPCAVCLSPNKGTVLTIPGTNTCLGDQEWTLEYEGYMMSSYYNHDKSDFVCVDQRAEGIPRTSYSNNEARLYVADAKCSANGGGLPCPPYVDGYDILCAVCTL